MQCRHSDDLVESSLTQSLRTLSQESASTTRKARFQNYQYTRLTLGLFVKKRYGTDDVAFGELDEQFIREYMDFCLDQRGLALDTVRHYLAILKKTCRIAFKAGNTPSVIILCTLSYLKRKRIHQRH